MKIGYPLFPPQEPTVTWRETMTIMKSVLNRLAALAHIVGVALFASIIFVLFAAGCGYDAVGQGDVEVAVPASAPDPRFTAPGNPDSPPCLGCGYAASVGESKSVAAQTPIAAPPGFTLPLDLGGAPLKAYPAYEELCSGGDVAVRQDCRSSERYCSAPANHNVAVGAIDLLWCASTGQTTLVLVCPTGTTPDKFVVARTAYAGCSR